MPVASIAGGVENARLPVVPVTVAANETVWLVSSLGPVEIAVAKPSTLTAPASSFTAAALAGSVNDGTSLIGAIVMVTVAAAL